MLRPFNECNEAFHHFPALATKKYNFLWISCFFQKSKNSFYFF